MEPPQREQDDRFLELMREKRALENEIKAREEEVAQAEAEYQAKKARFDSQKDREKEETKAIADAFDRDLQALRSAESSLSILRVELVARQKEINDRQEDEARAGTELNVARRDLDLQLAAHRQKLQLKTNDLQLRNEGMKAARRLDLEDTRKQYQDDIRAVRESTNRHRELAAGVEAANRAWKARLEAQRKDQAGREKELTKIMLQLKTVQQHIALMESEYKSLESEAKQQQKEVQTATVSRDQLRLEVQALDESCKKLNSRNETLQVAKDQLGKEVTSMFDQLSAANARKMKLQQDLETYRNAIERIGTDYKHLDHTVAFVLQPEAAKLSDSIKQHDVALSDLRESHRQQKDFLLQQRDSLAERLKKPAVRGREPINLDARYVEKSSEVRAQTPVRAADSTKAAMAREQLETAKTSLAQLKSTVAALTTQFDSRGNAHRRLFASFSQHSLLQRNYKQIALAAGVAVGALLEYWMQWSYQ